jgi:hypothetical protein
MSRESFGESEMSYEWSIVNRLSISINKKALFKSVGLEPDFWVDPDDLCKAAEKKCDELKYKLTEFDSYDLTFTFEFNDRPTLLEINKIAGDISNSMVPVIEERSEFLNEEEDEQL